MELGEAVDFGVDVGVQDQLGVVELQVEPGGQLAKEVAVIALVVLEHVARPDGADAELRKEAELPDRQADGGEARKGALRHRGIPVACEQRRSRLGRGGGRRGQHLRLELGMARECGGGREERDRSPKLVDR